MAWKLVVVFLMVLIMPISSCIPALTANAQNQSGTSTSQIPLGLHFEGIRCPKCGFYPPDVQLAVGPKNVMEATNFRIGIWTKDGTLVKNETLDSLFNSSNPKLTDPRLAYDNTSSRWFASAFVENGSTVYLAISHGSDPILSWEIHSFNSSTPCPDQPSLGVNNDTVEISVNAYTECTESGHDFVGVEYWIISKADLLADASPLHQWHYGPVKYSNGVFDFHPVRSFTASNMSYMVSVGSNGSTHLFISAVQGAPPNPRSWDSGWPTLTIPITSAPPNATQRGSAHLINTVDSRIQDAIFYKGIIWLAFNQACVPQNDTVLRSCIEIIGIQTHGTSREFNASSIKETLAISGSGSYYYFPALVTDKSGDLIMVFGYSSQSDYASLAYTTIRVNGTTASVASQPVTVQKGTGPDTIQCGMVHGVCRYGDYFGAAPDPSDGRVVWVAGETMTSTGWSTTIAELGVVPQGISAVTVVIAVILTIAAGILVAYVVVEIWDRIHS